MELVKQVAQLALIVLAVFCMLGGATYGLSSKKGDNLKASALTLGAVVCCVILIHLI
jgi:hypothetical protein